MIFSVIVNLLYVLNILYHTTVLSLQGSQRSLSSPTLFNLYINDSSANPLTHLKLFADDSALNSSRLTSNIPVCILLEHFNNMLNYFHAWKNSTLTTLMIILVFIWYLLMTRSEFFRFREHGEEQRRVMYVPPLHYPIYTTLLLLCKRGMSTKLNEIAIIFIS